MIKAEIFNQRIKLNTESVASDSVKYLKIKFFTDSDWEGALKTAVFKNESLGISKVVVLDNGSSMYLGDNTCIVPYEVIKPPCFSVSLSGIKGETVITTIAEHIKVYQSGDTSGDQPEDYTPSQYEQLLNICNETNALAQSVRDDADNGVFNGEKGEKGDTATAEINYNPESENAQSGKAVAEAVNGTYNIFAPLITKSVSGNIINACDVSFFEHELTARLKSKNLFSYSPSVFPQTLNGVTFTDNGDGTISVSGAVEASSTSNFIPLETITLKAGTYTISSNNTSDYAYLYFSLGSNNYWVNTPQTITLTQTTNLAIQIIVVSNYSTEPIAVSGVIKPQIEQGSTATDWIGPITDFSGMTVTRYGKNIFDNVFEEGSISSTTGNNSANITATRTANYIPILPNTQYTMTNPIASTSQKTRFYDKDKNYIGYSMGNSKNFISNNTNNLIVTGTTPNNAYYMRFEINFSSSLSTAEQKALVKAFANGEYPYQFELGSVATEYEPCNTQTVTANADGTVNGLTSVSPTMTILSHNPNSVLDCQYNADTKTYIDNLVKSLL